MINQAIIAATFALMAQVSIPTEVRVAPGRLFKISATSEAKVIKWVNVSDDADLIVSDNGRWAIFCSTVPGKYKLFCWTATGDIPSDAAVCTVTVIGSSPPPPVIPVDSAMLDELKAELEKIEDKDKKELVGLLIKAYQAVVAMLDSTEIDTGADFLLLARAASKKHIPLDKLLPLREVFAKDLDLIVSTNPTDKFTAKNKFEAKEKFKTYIYLLEQL